MSTIYNIIMSAENIINMYKDYKRSGGFGIYKVESLMSKNLKTNDIPTLLNQEQKLIELYCMTYDKPITLNILEKKYLGRKRVSVYNRIQYRHTNSINALNTSVKLDKVDAYTYFMKNNSIHGYMNREYWKENELMKKELTM
jgi:hypothetical protein